MPGPTWSAGSWCDVVTVVSGYGFARILADGQTVDLGINGSGVWQRDALSAARYIRAAANPATDVVKCIVTREIAGVDRLWLVEQGALTDLSLDASGVLPADIQYEGAPTNDFVVYCRISSTEYVRYPLAGTPTTLPIGYDAGSQGMRYVSGTTPQWITLAPPPDANWAEQTILGVRFRYPVTRGGVTIGQVPTAGDVIALAHTSNSVVQAIIAEPGFEPRVAPYGDGSGLIAACARTNRVGTSNAALVTGPTWPGSAILGGNTLTGAKPPGPRKVGNPPLPLVGGNTRGVIVTDPAGRATTLPFVSGSTDFLRGDGVFAPPPGSPAPAPGLVAVYFVPLSTGGEPLELISDGDGRVMLVPWSPE